MGNKLSTYSLLSYYLCCDAKAVFPLTLPLLINVSTSEDLSRPQVSAKYLKSTIERSVSHLVHVFWPCRALTSLMKT